jgi:hypothetical protein
MVVSPIQSEREGGAVMAAARPGVGAPRMESAEVGGTGSWVLPVEQKPEKSASYKKEAGCGSPRAGFEFNGLRRTS